MQTNWTTNSTGKRIEQTTGRVKQVKKAMQTSGLVKQLTQDIETGRKWGKQPEYSQRECCWGTDESNQGRVHNIHLGNALHQEVMSLIWDLAFLMRREWLSEKCDLRSRIEYYIRSSQLSFHRNWRLCKCVKTKTTWNTLANHCDCTCLKFLTTFFSF